MTFPKQPFRLPCDLPRSQRPDLRDHDQQLLRRPVRDGNAWQRLIGGGYTVYADGQSKGGAVTGVSFVGNGLRRGFCGYAPIQRNSPVWEANADDRSGARRPLTLHRTDA